jgi:hypothetical protein
MCKEWYLVICSKWQKVATRDYSVLVGITMFIFTHKMYLSTIIMKVLALLLIKYQAPFPDIFNFKAWIFRETLIA